MTSLSLSWCFSYFDFDISWQTKFVWEERCSRKCLFFQFQINKMYNLCPCLKTLKTRINFWPWSVLGFWSRINPSEGPSLDEIRCKLSGGTLKVSLYTSSGSYFHAKDFLTVQFSALFFHFSTVKKHMNFFAIGWG